MFSFTLSGRSTTSRRWRVDEPAAQSAATSVAATVAAAIAASAMILTLGPATRAGASDGQICVDYDLNPTSSPHTGSHGFDGFEPLGSDLNVRVFGPPGQALIQLFDQDGDPLASEIVDLVDGRAAVRLPGALATLPERGFQLHARLTDAATETTLATVPLRAGLDCDAGDRCRWTLTAGLESDGPVADRPLMAIYDQLVAAGVDDPFGVIHGQYPELRSSLYELALQLRSFEATGTARTKARHTARSTARNMAAKQAEDACQCQWVGVHGMTSPWTSGSFDSHPPRHEHADWSAHDTFWAAQILEGQISRPFPAVDLYQRLQLVCATFLGATTHEITFGDGGPGEVPIPILANCEVPCEGQIAHTATVNTCVGAKAFGRQSHQATADVELLANVSVDGAPLFGVPIDVTLATQDPAGELQIVTGSQSGTAHVYQNRSELSHRLDGSTALKIQGISTPSPYIFAGATSQPLLLSQGEAACAIIEHQSLTSGPGSGSGGGSVIERWGDPP